MALSRRTGARFQASIWPGFVDAMTGLLLVLMFVLTIFMVIQFVLRETISGQEDQLNELSAEVALLADALGLERGRSADLGERVGRLTSSLNEANATADAQSTLIDTLTAERDATALALSEAQSRITGFEAQVAGLLAERRDRNAQISELEAETTRLLSEQEALNLALAQARSEIDAGAEEARLAAARREAMEALVADLEARSESDAARISELEAAQLLDAAAAEALRERLANADTELTAMTLALEEKRREAEETLTLLAAAQSAQDGLDVELAAAVAALRLANEQRDAARQEVADLDQRLAAIALLNEASDADLQAARDLVAAGEQAMDALRAEIAVLTSERDALLANTSDQDRIGAELRAQLAAALQGQADRTTERDQQAELLAIARQNLSEQEQISTEAQREVALLNEQIAALRQQIGTLQSLLDIAAESDTEAQVQIAELGAQLNVALARAAAEERRRRTLEEAERARLEEEAARLAAEAQNLERFRSDFFGQLRDVVEGEDGVRIEGDRFVFSSEVLFRPGQAELSVEGQAEIAKVADILRRISADIPDGIDWVIRVDGHTDNVPLSGRGAFANNWELSQARALSVVLYMSGSLGIAPERLAANGFGQYQPLDPADTPEARAQNRRIELKLTER